MLKHNKNEKKYYGKDAIADDIMTVEEVSEFLGFSRSKIYKMAQMEEIPAFKISRSWRFSRHDIMEWLSSLSTGVSEKNKEQEESEQENGEKYAE